MKKHQQNLIAILIITAGCMASPAVLGQSPAASKIIFTADSLASGNSKDVLTSFFQAAFNNLTGKRKEFNFNSNPYAVMLKSNPKLALDKYYSKYTPLRRLNFGFGIGLDTSYRFNGFSSGIKYSIIDERDHTMSAMFAERLKVDGLAAERAKINKALGKYAQDRYKASAKTDADFQQLSDFRDSISAFFNQKIAYKKLNPAFKSALDKILQEEEGVDSIRAFFKLHPDSSLKARDEAVFNNLKNELKKNTLWTIALSDTTLSSQFAFSNVVISSEFSKGVFKPQPGANNLELNIKAACNFLRDTLQAGNNLKRSVLSFEPGINWVIRDKLGDKSYLELKFSGSWYHRFSGLYAGEDRDLITANCTLRVRILDDIWVPLEIKYDPSHGNVFGFLNVKANFTGLGKLLKGSADQ